MAISAQGARGQRGGVRSARLVARRRPPAARAAQPRPRRTWSGLSTFVTLWHQRDRSGTHTTASRPFFGPTKNCKSDDPRADVEAMGLGLTFSVSDGAFAPPRPELLD
eukprot:5546241-Pyramimonas_sp.AAC.1